MDASIEKLKKLHRDGKLCLFVQSYLIELHKNQERSWGIAFIETIPATNILARH